MKSLIILFADNFSNFGFEKTFNGKSAFEITIDWAKNVKSASKIQVFCFDNNKELVVKNLDSEISFKSRQSWTQENLFAELNDSLRNSNSSNKNDFDYVIFSYAFNPFINLELTEKLITTHENFKSEYSFADGYPKSVCPEILDSGLVNILNELIKTKDDLKNKSVSKDSIFDLIKTDINSFEIETEISSTDWRLYRFDFSCDKKENYIACLNLFEKVLLLPKDEQKNLEKICELASKEVKVLKTIPSYFNIQIENSYQSKNPFNAYSVLQIKQENRMLLTDFKSLIKKINNFNSDAVVSLSLWGDPILHPDFFEIINQIISYPGLSVLIETDGFDFSQSENLQIAENIKKLQELSQKVKNLGIRKNGYAPIIWIVNLDAMTQKTYEKIHPGMKLENAIFCVEKLNKLFEKNVYVQFLRIQQNEEELESFYRTYKKQDYISSGNFIIKKYDSFCKKLPELKSADLAPIERNPCWHLRRDFDILANGQVPICFEKSFEQSLGNAFTEELETLWNKKDLILQNDVEKKYCEGCNNCDEFYTFNF